MDGESQDAENDVLSSADAFGKSDALSGNGDDKGGGIDRDNKGKSVNVEE